MSHLTLSPTMKTTTEKLAAIEVAKDALRLFCPPWANSAERAEYEARQKAAGITQSAANKRVRAAIDNVFSLMNVTTTQTPRIFHVERLDNGTFIEREQLSVTFVDDFAWPIYRRQVFPAPQFEAWELATVNQ